jgi:dethiobiotin synthase
LRIIFITGTDTGVGKTLLTSLLLTHLRRTGHHALALKPFCSGSRADAKLLHALQDGELTLDEINPFFFLEPLAPLVAARRRRRRIRLGDVLEHIQTIASRQLAITDRPLQNKNQKSKIKYILIEGAGGLLAPLGENFTALDLIRHLRSEVIVVSRNQLGTINQTLLTVQALQTTRHGASRTSRHASGMAPHASLRLALKVILMDPRKKDPSAASNPRVLSEFLAPIALFSLPFLGLNCGTVKTIRPIEKEITKMLARILA